MNGLMWVRSENWQTQSARNIWCKHEIFPPPPLACKSLLPLREREQLCERKRTTNAGEGSYYIVDG